MRARLRWVWIGWLVFGAIQASGQRAPAIMCGVTPETPVRIVRAEQALEEVGEGRVTCEVSDQTPGQPPPTVTIQVGLNVNITSRPIGNTGLTEAMLYLAGTTPANTKICGGSEAPMNDRWECPGANTWPGRSLGNNWLEFSPISFTTSQQTYDITGVRGAALQAEPGPDDRRLIRMELRGAIGMRPFQFNTYGGSIIVGEAKKSLQATITGFQGDGNAQNPELLNVTGPVAASSIPAGRTAKVEFRGLTQNALRPNENFDDDDGVGRVRRIDELLRQSDQQRLAPVFSSNQGTRLAVKFSNVPAGVKTFLPGRCEDSSGETIAELLGLPPGSEQNPLAGLYFLGAVFSLQTGETLAQWRIRTARAQAASLVTCAIVLAFAAPDQPIRGFGFPGYSGDKISGTDASFDLSGSYHSDEAATEPGLAFDSVQPDRKPFLFFQTPGSPAQWTFILPTGSRTPTLQLGELYKGLDQMTYHYLLTQTGATSQEVTGISVDASPTGRPLATVNWLTAEALSTQTPVPIAVSFNPAGLAPGVYDGAVRATRTGLPSLGIPIVLTITPPGPTFSPWGFANAGSYANNVVAPGEAAVIFGKRFGPPSLATAELAADGKLSTRIGNTRVLFDGVAAPMIYAVDGQVSCLAPFALADKRATSVQVEYQGVLSPAIRLPVTPAVPALLTADSSGFGQAAALNQDNSFNSVRGEAPGNYVSFFGVGGPNTTPGGLDGAITRAPFPQFPGTPTVWFDGVEAPAADVAYLGPAPELVSGVFQAVVRIPAAARPGSRIEVRIRFGKYITQPGVYFTVR